eukprot:2501380-Amphidinium_carterae.1
MHCQRPALYVLSVGGWQHTRQNDYQVRRPKTSLPSHKNNAAVARSVRKLRRGPPGSWRCLDADC